MVILMIDPDYWLKKADEFRNNGEYDEAINCYEKILDYNPIDVFAVTMIGTCFSESGQFENALIYVNKALDIDSNYDFLWFNKGMVYFENKDYEDALEYYDKAISLNKEDSTSWYFKGWSYFYLKNISKAIECFETSYNIDFNEDTKELIDDLKNKSNTKMQCPNCHAEIDDRYKFCIKCGFDLRNIPNQNPYDVLKENINHVISYAEMMDEHFYYLEDSPLVYDWKDKELSVKLGVLGDFIDWLVYLGLADGYIAPEEVQFINNFLGFNFTQKDILDLIPNTLTEDYFSTLPPSFKLFYDNDFLHREYQNEQNFEGTAEILFNIYGLMEELFIACDGYVAPEEKNVLNGYMNNLRRNLDLFKNNLYPLLRESLITERIKY